MKVIKLNPIPSSIDSSIFNAYSYPATGCYFQNNTIYLVDKEVNTVNSYFIQEKFISELDQEGISENMLLKAIAIAQRPELIKELNK